MMMSWVGERVGAGVVGVDAEELACGGEGGEGVGGGVGGQGR